MFDQPADSELLILTQSLVASETYGFGTNQRYPGLAVAIKNFCNPKQNSIQIGLAQKATTFNYVKCVFFS